MKLKIPAKSMGKARVRSKADDPWVSKQTILERMKADDPDESRRSWAKADDLGRKQTMFCLKLTIS